MTARAGDLRVGTSGWTYADWVGPFYPEGLPERQWLAHYQGQFDSVELNVTFYRLPPAATFRNWRERAPEGFRFAVKGPRLVTHYLKLRRVEEILAIFARRVRLLGDRLGPVLWQLPYALERDDARLGRFLAVLPRDLAHAFEFRHPSWFAEPVYALLTGYGAAQVVWHMPDCESPVRATARHVYLRFHGTTALYEGAYSHAQLEGWAARVRDWLAEGRDVWAFFNNDVGAHAPRDAQRLRELVGVPLRPLEPASPPLAHHPRRTPVHK